jgi:hypothetical protein
MITRAEFWRSLTAFVMVPAINGHAAQGSTTDPVTAYLYLTQARPPRPCTGGLWVPLNPDNSPRAIAEWQIYTADGWHALGSDSVDVSVVDAAWRASSTAHLAALDPHGDRAFANARLAALLAANPGLTPPS